MVEWCYICRILMWIFIQPHTFTYASFNTFEWLKMHCNVSQWFVRRLQRLPWMRATLSNDEEWFSNVVQRLFFLRDNRSDLFTMRCTSTHAPWVKALHDDSRVQNINRHIVTRHQLALSIKWAPSSDGPK